jgi:hypothetical protein
MHRMQAVRAAAAAAVLLASAGAQAGIVFTPHVSEYARLAPGQYTELTLVNTEIEKIYDENGKVVRVGTPFVPAGGSTDASLLLLKYAWFGNAFRDSDVWYLKDHPQFCRVIGTLQYQQNTEQVARRTRIFGAKPGGNGFGDVFGLCGVHTDEYRWGPVMANGMWATTVKFPVGNYDTDAILNTGTHYWSYIPSFAFHSELFGRIYVDGIFAYQINENNDSPSFLGLTPTRIADWRNYEVNVAWKFNEHWFAEVGYGHRESVGSNYYDKVDVTNEEPVRAEDGCRNLSLPPDQCNATNQFYVQSPAGAVYKDKGVEGTAITAGFVYIYRTSSVFNARVFVPIDGRGSQITVPFDVYNARPDGNGGYVRGNDTGINSPSKLFGVQEAAAVSASPFLELRFVYLFWAP